MAEGFRRTGLIWQMLCATTWALAWLMSQAQGSSVSPAFLSTSVPVSLDGANVTSAASTNHTVSESAVVCLTPSPPQWGSFSVVNGTGVADGDVLVFWCQEGFQLVGSETMSCIPQGGWSNHPPVCERKTESYHPPVCERKTESYHPPVCEHIPRPERRGLVLAVLVSAVSSIIILTMAACFIVCCLQEHGETYASVLRVE